MVRKLLILLVGGVLAGSLMGAGAPAQAQRSDLEIYSQGPYEFPYSFTAEDCKNLHFRVEGRNSGYEIIYIVPNSRRQAFLDDNRYQFQEVWTNPANGRKAYVSGKGHFREVKAEHVDGDVWRFLSVDTGQPFVVRNDKGHVVLSDEGRIVRSTLFDTLGDGQPGGDVLDETVVSQTGHFPSREPDFDFCALVSRVLG
jgi:hypothetical protein